MTKKLTSVALENGIQTDAITDNIMTGIVTTRGMFQALIICEMQNSLCDKLVLEMNLGDKLNLDDQILYIKEYLNIICGKALSDINNQLGSRSKLSVPHIVQGSYGLEEKHDYILKHEFIYASDYGRMNVSVYYKLLSIYA